MFNNGDLIKEVKKISGIETQLDNITTLTIKQFPKLNVETDDTPRIKRAIEKCKQGGYGCINFFAEDYYISDKILIDGSGIKFKGVGMGRNGDGMLNTSTVFKISYNGICFDIGGQTTPLYSGKQFTEFYDIHFMYVGNQRSELENPLGADYGKGFYGTNAKCIYDWQGGNTFIERCWFENFEVAIGGETCDICHFTDIQLNYNKYGMKFINIPQTKIENVYSFGNDIPLYIDSTSSLEINNWKFVKEAKINGKPIVIFQSNDITFNNCWFESHNRSDRKSLSYVSIAENNDVNKCKNIYFNNCNFLSNTGQMDYLLSIGRANNVKMTDCTIGRGLTSIVEFTEGDTKDFIFKGNNPQNQTIYTDNSTSHLIHVFSEVYTPTGVLFDGNMQMPNKTVYAYRNNTDLELVDGAWTKLICDTIDDNPLNTFNLETGIFTSKQSSYYLVEVGLLSSQGITGEQKLEVGIGVDGQGGVTKQLLLQKDKPTGGLYISSGTIKVNSGRLIDIKAKITGRNLTLLRGKNNLYIMITKL